MSLTVPVLRERQVIFRERDFPISREVMSFIKALRDNLGLNHSTGVLCIHLGQGGPCALAFREEAQVK